MNKLMTTTALALAVAGGTVFAAGHSSGPFTDYQMDPATDLLASDLIGARIYATETEVGDTAEEGAETEWDDLGEINDMILNRDGSVQVVILGVGGFLGIGEQDVAIQMDQIKFVSDGEEADDYFLVINASQEAVENAPEFQRTDMEEDMGDGSEGAEMSEETEAVEGAVESEAGETEAEVENAAESTEQAAEEAASDTEQAAEEAASETEQATEEAAAETEQAAEEAGDAVENAAEGAEAEVEEETAN